MIEARFYQKLKNEKVQCRTCSHYCLIAPTERGKCGVRENQNGKLYFLAYGKVIALNIDPVEKKPLFHFQPQTETLSLATVGCNFSCLNCQNWEISQQPKPKNPISEGEGYSPEKIIFLAKKNHLPSISYTYTEPTIFLEYALDIMKIAKREGLKNIWVTNGFFSEETFKLISPYLDAANVDLKSFSEKFYKEICGGRLRPVLDNLKRLKKRKIWLELTTLAIPTLSDSEEIFKKIANFIKTELGVETPWHISRFSGALSWKLTHLPDTAVEVLKMAYEIGKSAGLKYVYTGNVPGLPSEDTFCPKCGTLAIDRRGYLIHRYDKSGKCSKCGASLDIVE